MVKYFLWGTEVDLDLPKETFPTEQEIEEMDENVFNPQHGFFEYTTTRSNGANDNADFNDNGGDDNDDNGESFKLHYRKYVPVDDDIRPRAVCVFQHGIGGHSATACKLYDEVTEEWQTYKFSTLYKSLIDAGYALYSLDMLGHGFSEGLRFYIPNGDWTVNRDCLDAFALFAASEHDGVPLFLMGESYGGCLALHVAKKWQENLGVAPSTFSGLCLFSPAIEAKLPPQPIIFALTLLAYFFPAQIPFFLPHRANPKNNWKHEKIMKKFHSDREKEMRLQNAGNRYRLGTALGLLEAVKAVHSTVIPGLNVPFSVAHGTKDVGIPASGTEYLLETASTPLKDRRVRIVDDGVHDLLSEDCREKTVEFFVNWMNDVVCMRSL
jgi:alpha-beta hydrolase superfamily lysophospholipase